MLFRFLAFMLIVLPIPAIAQDLAGSWALRIEGTTIFRFDLEPAGDNWKGNWSKPRSFASDGDSFARLSGPPVLVAAGEGRAIGEWAELTFPDPRPGAVPDIFRFRLLDKDRAEMIYVDTGLAPFQLVRVPVGAQLGPWEAGKIYRRPGAPIPRTPAAPRAARQGANAGTGWSLPPSPAPERPPAVEGR
jgi:hypothetical protein